MKRRHPPFSLVSVYWRMNWADGWIWLLAKHFVEFQNQEPGSHVAEFLRISSNLCHLSNHSRTRREIAFEQPHDQFVLDLWAVCPFDRVYIAFHQKMRTLKLIKFLFCFAGSSESDVKLTSTNFIIPDSQYHLFLREISFSFYFNQTHMWLIMSLSEFILDTDEE